MLDLDHFKLSKWCKWYSTSRKEFVNTLKHAFELEHINNTISVILDHCLGVLLFIILYKTDILMQILPLLFKLINFMEWNVQWFITNPGGFKFNVNFNSFLSSLSLFFILCIDCIYSIMLFISNCFTFTPLGGITFIASFIENVLQIIFFPIEMLNIFFSALYKTHFH
ncbi:N-acetylglucosaminyl-phosphatidylinositol biosynthetic protein gpi1 [Entamoeba marina]